MEKSILGFKMEDSIVDWYKELLAPEIEAEKEESRY